MGMTGFAVAAFVGIFVFYMPTTFGKFTAFMFGYVGITALTTGGGPAFMLVGAAWLVAALVWWLVTGFRAYTTTLLYLYSYTYKSKLIEKKLN